jgi:hypothetical protein
MVDDESAFINCHDPSNETPSTLPPTSPSHADKTDAPMAINSKNTILLDITITIMITPLNYKKEPKPPNLIYMCKKKTDALKKT